MPTLKYEMKVVDERNLNVLAGSEKSSIMPGIDLQQNTISDNILGTLHISEVYVMAEMDRNIMADGTFCQVIRAGDKYHTNHWTIDGAK
jgi:hypothetical protein